MPTRQELLARFGKVDDPEIEARRQHILEVLLAASPQTQERLRLEARQQGVFEGLLIAARTAVRRVLACRQLILTAGDDARIEDCTDLATLERWLDQAITALSVSDALK
jgi:hypothetical protein